MSICDDVLTLALILRRTVALMMTVTVGLGVTMLQSLSPKLERIVTARIHRCRDPRSWFVGNEELARQSTRT